eukprot:gene15531-18450_t
MNDQGRTLLTQGLVEHSDATFHSSSNVVHKPIDISRMVFDYRIALSIAADESHAWRRKYTEFCTDMGVLQWVVVLFGLKNSPAAFVRWLSAALKQYAGIVVVYIDDILVYSKLFNDHVKHVRMIHICVLQTCREEKIYLNSTKCEMFKDHIGFSIGPDGIRTKVSLVKAITDYAVPTTVKELEQFKEAISSAPVLVQPDFSQPFHVFGDASDV